MNVLATIPPYGAAPLLPDAGVDVCVRGGIKINMSQDPALPLKRNTSWLHDLSEAIPAAIGIYGDDYRKFGRVPLSAHVIWTANKIFNDFLRRYGREYALLAAFIQLMHDRVEDGRAYAKKRGLAFDEAKLLNSICDLWDRICEHRGIKRDDDLVKAHRKLITETIRWMTDNPAYSGWARIHAQIDKSFRNVFIIDCTSIEQKVRNADKRHHAAADAAQRRAFKAFSKSGQPLPKMLAEKRAYGVPDEDVGECFKKAFQKAYILGFPAVSLIDKVLYLKDMLYLGKEAFSVGISQSFKNSAELLVQPAAQGPAHPAANDKAVATTVPAPAPN